MKTPHKPRLTEEEMTELALKMVQEYVNSCRCKNKDDVLLALGHWLNVGIGAGEAVQSTEIATVQ